jgi:hypothetical protein
MAGFLWMPAKNGFDRGQLSGHLPMSLRGRVPTDSISACAQRPAAFLGRLIVRPNCIQP